MWTRIAKWGMVAGACALAVWYILHLNGANAELEQAAAQQELRIAELTANAVQMRIEAQQDLDARGAALTQQRRETVAAQKRANTLAQAMENSNEECFSRELPSTVLDSLRD